MTMVQVRAWTFITVSLVFLSCAQKDPPKPASAPVKITQFYASPPNPPKGEKTLVCYGVDNATEVKIDPPIDRLWPTNARCLEFVPTTESTLTLTASNASSQAVRSIKLTPGPPAVKLLEVNINTLEPRSGDQVVLCYKAENAVDGSIKPGMPYGTGWPNAGCIVDRPSANTTYIVKVNGAGGDDDTERLTVKVK